MNTPEKVVLQRDCEGIQVPSGQQMVLAKGSEVRITQSLGGSYTVMTEMGYMLQISGKDADALGKSGDTSLGGSSPVSGEPGPETPLDEKALEKSIWEQMRTCYDPEIPVNIADLGLVYACQILPLPEGGRRVEIKMTLTAPGCGMGEVLKQDVQNKISRLPGVKQCQVELVWDPPWDRSRLSDAAKLQLGMM